jgi:hypothetical protein
MRARSDTALSNVLTLPANVNKDTGNWSLAPSLRKVFITTTTFHFYYAISNIFIGPA